MLSSHISYMEIVLKISVNFKKIIAKKKHLDQKKLNPTENLVIIFFFIVEYQRAIYDLYSFLYLFKIKIRNSLLNQNVTFINHPRLTPLRILPPDFNVRSYTKKKRSV